MQRDLKALCDGALGGAIGTAAMSAVMLGARRAGLMSGQPPEAITAAAMDASGMHEQDPQTQDTLASLLHFGFGIGLGAVFGLLSRRFLSRLPAVVSGAGFGTLVWAVSYQGWIPALGIMPPASRDEPGRPQTMVFAHWVYGALLGGVIGQRAADASDREQ